LFITGASRGIGLAIALRAARDGANIAIAAKTETPNPKLEGTIYTAAEAIERLRELEPDAESVYYVYVIDEEEHLLGVLSLRDLIVAKPETKIRDFMIKNVISVRLDAGPREVAEVTSKYNLLAVPVVDEHNRIHGIVTVDDVMERVMPARAGGRRRRIF